MAWWRILGWTNAVAHELEIDSAMPLADAARISIADTVYFRCQSTGGADDTGGVLDLFPIEPRELAHGSAASLTKNINQNIF